MSGTSKVTGTRVGTSCDPTRSYCSHSAELARGSLFKGSVPGAPGVVSLDKKRWRSHGAFSKSPRGYFSAQKNRVVVAARSALQKTIFHPVQLAAAPAPPALTSQSLSLLIAPSRPHISSSSSSLLLPRPLASRHCRRAEGGDPVVWTIGTFLLCTVHEQDFKIISHQLHNRKFILKALTRKPLHTILLVAARDIGWKP
eukprot:747565-Hanusia_phi.AAC.1